MMKIALVVSMMAAQDAPAVSYREGLFEEVDQGNLEKAMQHYDKVLKSNAEAPLKAKALFRKAYCLEKLGRAKDAEQGYRDVIERHPAQEETVRLARGRLAAISAPASATVPVEQIQQLILDLGIDTSGGIDAGRSAAIRRLTLIGAVCVPELKRASQHRDERLSSGAAHVLALLGQYEGLYDVFVRAQELDDAYGFARLLDERADDWKRFVRDARTLRTYFVAPVARLSKRAPGDRDLREVIEARYVEEEKIYYDDHALNAWLAVGNATDLPSFIERVSTAKTARANRLYRLAEKTGVRVVRQEEVAPPISAAFLKAFQGPDMLKECAKLKLLDKVFESLSSLMTSQDFVRGLLASWLKAGDAALCDHIRTIPNLHLPTEFLFEIVASPDYPEDVRGGLIGRLPGSQPPREQMPSVIEYLLGYLAKHPQNEYRTALENYAVTHLPQWLPDDAPQLDAIFDRQYESRNVPECIYFGETKRKRFIEAAFRALPGPFTSDALSALQHATAEEKLQLAGILRTIREDLFETAANLFCDALSKVEAADLAKPFTALTPFLKEGKTELRVYFLDRMHLSHPVLDIVMKDLVTDPDRAIRKQALQYWAWHSSGGIPQLLQGLNDSDATHRQLAITALGDRCALEAVPALLEAFKRGGQEQESAQKALDKIKNHIEKQREWQEWYEGVKKK